jgi:hypothetical protein
MEKVELEQLVKSLTVSNGQNSSTDSQTTPRQQTFSDHERDVTGYLFAKLVVLYAGAFYLVYPSLKEADFAKREYAKQIGKYSREQIDTALKLLASLAISPERENRIFREPNIPAVLALMEEAVKRDRAHQLFLPVPQESDEDKEKRLELGRKEAERLLAMFDEPKEPKPLTKLELDDLDKLERLKNE